MISYLNVFSKIQRLFLYYPRYPSSGGIVVKIITVSFSPEKNNDSSENFASLLQTHCKKMNYTSVKKIWQPSPSSLFPSFFFIDKTVVKGFIITPGTE